jgi:hypothetical protein
MLRGLMPSSVVSGMIDPKYMLSSERCLDLRHHDEYLLYSHEPLVKFLLQEDEYDFSEASWERLKGYLHLLQAVISSMGFTLSSMVPMIFKSVVSILKMTLLAMQNNESMTIDNDLGKEDDDEEEEIGDEKEENIDVTVDKHLQNQLALECRNLAFHRLKGQYLCYILIIILI